MAKKGSKFTKYSPEFKLQVVDYLSAKSGGMPTIVKKYGLKSDNQVLTWTRKIKRYDSLRIQVSVPSKKLTFLTVHFI